VAVATALGGIDRCAAKRRRLRSAIAIRLGLVGSLHKADP
jgi:hypothetical protein